MKIYKVVPYKINKRYLTHIDLYNPCEFCAFLSKDVCLIKCPCFHFEVRFKLKDTTLFFVEK